MNFTIAHNKRDYIVVLHVPSVKGAHTCNIFYFALRLFVPFDKIHIMYQACLLHGTVGHYPPPPKKKSGERKKNRKLLFNVPPNKDTNLV